MDLSVELHPTLLDLLHLRQGLSTSLDRASNPLSLRYLLFPYLVPFLFHTISVYDDPRSVVVMAHQEEAQMKTKVSLEGTSVLAGL